MIIAIASESACFVDTRAGQYVQRPDPSNTAKREPHDDMIKGPFRQFAKFGVVKANITKSMCVGRRDIVVWPILAFMMSVHPTKSNAACLPGDIRSECIGVYKMPLDDAVLSYVESPEQLKKFAPDLNWVRSSNPGHVYIVPLLTKSSLFVEHTQVPPIEYPSTYSAAVTQIEKQRDQLNAAKEFILKGDLNQGGLILLDVVPKLSSSKNVILKQFGNALNNERNLEMKRSKKSNGTSNSSEKATMIDMKAYRFEYAINELLGYLGETDVLIGQGLRGELGVFAPAQLQILSSLDEARIEFDEMLRSIPDKI